MLTTQLRPIAGLAAVLAMVALLALPRPLPAAAAEALPSSMSALGDSLTRAFDACGWYFDCLDWSWSTGAASGVNSQYLRLRALNPAISGRAYNDARTGAKMADLDGQARVAVGRGVEYVTILMGANDACTSSEAAMTPVATFRAQFAQAIATLSSGLPGARVFVASIPDAYRLWAINKDSASARNTWATFQICQSLLANPLSTAPADVERRARVRQRIVDYNRELATVCRAHVRCRFDTNAVFNYPFQVSDVSPWDYFHASTVGERRLADVTWNAGFWGGNRRRGQ